MDLRITDEEIVAAVVRLARVKKTTPVEAIREAVDHEYARSTHEMTFVEAVKHAQEELDAISRPGGLPADKAFFDELSGEDELTGLP